MATFHFVGSSGADLSQAANWSATQGGAGNAGVPGANDTAIFDQTNVSQINVTVKQNFNTLWVKSTAKVKFDPGSAARTIGTLKNDGLATFTGNYIIDEGDHSSIGTAYFVISTDIQNTGTLQVEQDILLRGGVSVQSGTFGWSGVLPEGFTSDPSCLWLGSPGGTLVPGTYGFSCVGPPMHNLQSLDTTALDAAVTANTTYTFSPGVYVFTNNFVPTASHSHTWTTNLQDCTVTCARFIATSQGSTTTLNLQGSTVQIQGLGTDLGYFLVGNDAHMVLNYDADTLIRALPPVGLDPETTDLAPFCIPIGGTVTLPPIEVTAQAVLVTDNPLDLPIHVDSITMLPGSGCLQNFHEVLEITVDHDWTAQDAFITSLGSVRVNLGGSFTFSGHILSMAPVNGPLEWIIGGDFTVRGTYLTSPEQTSLLAYLNPPLGEEYARSYFSVGNATSSERLYFDVAGTIDVQDLETYYAISTRDIISPSSIGCGNVRFVIESNCPGTEEHQRLAALHANIETQRHQSDMAWRTGRG